MHYLHYLPARHYVLETLPRKEGRIREPRTRAMQLIHFSDRVHTAPAPHASYLRPAVHPWLHSLAHPQMRTTPFSAQPWTQDRMGARTRAEGDVDASVRCACRAIAQRPTRRGSPRASPPRRRLPLFHPLRCDARRRPRPCQAQAQPRHPVHVPVRATAVFLPSLPTSPLHTPTPASESPP